MIKDLAVGLDRYLNRSILVDQNLRGTDPAVILVNLRMQVL